MKSISKFLFQACAFIALTCLVSSLWAQSSDSNGHKPPHWENYKISANDKEVQQEIKAIHESKTVNVMFTYPHVTEPPQNESEFRQRACKYPENDATKISTLEEIIRNANVKAISNPRGSTGTVAGIFLVLADQKELKILFDDDSPGEKTIEGSVEGTLGRQRIIANRAVVGELYLWAEKTGTKTFCEKLIRQ